MSAPAPLLARFETAGPSLAAAVTAALDSTLFTDLKTADPAIKQTAAELALLESLLFALCHWLRLAEPRLTVPDRELVCDRLSEQFVLFANAAVGLSFIGDEQRLPRENKVTIFREMLASHRVAYSKLYASWLLRIYRIFHNSTWLDRRFLHATTVTLLQDESIIIAETLPSKLAS